MLERITTARRRTILLALSLAALITCAAQLEASSGSFRAHVAAVSEALRQHRFMPDMWMQDNHPHRAGVDVSALRACAGFTMRLQSPRADDVLVAAGVALAAGRPSVYLVQKRDELPWFLREADDCFAGQVAILDVADALPRLRALNLRPHASGASNGPRWDAFIGCIMSGLTETEYAEARGHLQAIDAALRKLGCAHNFCEGIRVTDPSQFDRPRDALPRDLSAVHDSRRCVFYVYDAQPRPSGMWVEAGAALAAGKRCTFLVPDRRALPPCLRGARLPRGVRVIVFGSARNLMRALQDHPRTLLRTSVPWQTRAFSGSWVSGPICG